MKIVCITQSLPGHRKLWILCQVDLKLADSQSESKSRDIDLEEISKIPIDTCIIKNDKLSCNQMFQMNREMIRMLAYRGIIRLLDRAIKKCDSDSERRQRGKQKHERPEKEIHCGL